MNRCGRGQSLSFVGMYYLRSESGNVSIRAGEFSSDLVAESEVSLLLLSELLKSFDGAHTHILCRPKTLSEGRERHGSINCGVNGGSCLSFGDLHVRTSLGDIEIVVGCDSFQCV